jgi:hypothetical protein
MEHALRRLRFQSLPTIDRLPETEKRQLNSPGPHFLGIGAQKAGTTWLWAQLNRHPGVWMPIRKEVHYFSRYAISQDASILAETRLGRKLFGNAPVCRLWREMFRADLVDAIRAGDLQKLRWTLRYYCRAADDDWYRAMFPKDSNLTCGEISPSYSILDDTDVARIAGLFPGLRIILLLRNPIERAWSQVRFDWTRGAREGVGSTEEIKAFIDSPRQSLRSDYVRMLDIWSRHFPEGNIFVGFYDDIVARPAEILDRVQRFLGLESQPIEGGTLKKKIHVSREAVMPSEIRDYLIERYEPMMRVLQERFGEPATTWLKGIEEVRQADEKNAGKSTRTP